MSRYKFWLGATKDRKIVIKFEFKSLHLFSFINFMHILKKIPKNEKNA